VEGTEDYKFAKSFDWESDLKLWQDKRRKSDPANPITAFLGQLINCTGLTINFHGAVNFKG
jgi:hypothetical protein